MSISAVLDNWERRFPMTDSYRRQKVGRRDDGNAADIDRAQYLAPVGLIKSAASQEGSVVKGAPEVDVGNIHKVIRESVRKFIQKE
jgi:hypothetical protein